MYLYCSKFGLLLENFLPGDDWEHEETFTDDDEAVDIDPEERADLAPEIPAPPEIKQVDLYCCELPRITNCTSSNTFFTEHMHLVLKFDAVVFGWQIYLKKRFG